jgi:DNA repair protein RAD50
LITSSGADLPDTTEDLLHQFRNFDEHVKSIEGKRDRKVEDKRNEDLAIEDHRRRERNLLSTQGALVNNRKVCCFRPLRANRQIYERTVKEREAAIREVAKNQNFSGYDYSPLEEQKIEEFMDRLHELVRKAEMDLKRIQADGARKERQLQAELDLLSSAKTSAVATKQSKQDQIVGTSAHYATDPSDLSQRRDSGKGSQL